MWVHPQAQNCSVLSVLFSTRRDFYLENNFRKNNNKKSACFLFFGGTECICGSFLFFYTDVFHKGSFTTYFQLVKIIFPLGPKKFWEDPELKLWENHHGKTGILKLMFLQRRKISVCALWLICNHSMVFSAFLFLTCKIFSKLPSCFFRSCVRLHAASETKAVTVWHYKTCIFYFIEGIIMPRWYILNTQENEIN